MAALPTAMPHKCTSCSAGRYKCLAAERTCKLCPKGTSSIAGSSVCAKQFHHKSSDAPVPAAKQVTTSVMLAGMQPQTAFKSRNAFAAELSVSEKAFVVTSACHLTCCHSSHMPSSDADWGWT
jgi:hypothetical protein